MKSGSGASMYSKGDVAIKSVDILMECKTTSHASYSITRATLLKIAVEALGEGKDPAMEIEITGSPDPRCPDRWVLIPSSLFKDMVETISAHKEK